MSKFDKYYMKQGKLELSMLDEADEEQVELDEEINQEPKSELFSDFELRFPHTKRLKEKQTSSEVVKNLTFKISKDITETVQNMGQILNKVNTGDANMLSQNKGINSMKVQKLEQIAGTLKVEEIDLEINKEEIDGVSVNSNSVDNEEIRVKLHPLQDEVVLDMECKFKENELSTIINSHFNDMTTKILK